jgi:hypothetical protein
VPVGALADTEVGGLDLLSVVRTGAVAAMLRAAEWG